MSSEGSSTLITALTRAGHSNYVVFDASGHVEHAVGIFDPFADDEGNRYGEAQTRNGSGANNNRERANLRCKSAFLLVQQCLRVLRPDEKLKKITAEFDACRYTASVITIEGRTYGLVVRTDIAA